jgi:hypothetical protein
VAKDSTKSQFIAEVEGQLQERAGTSPDIHEKIEGYESEHLEEQSAF